MKINGFKNSNIYVEGRGIVKTSLLIENGKIKEISDDVKADNLLELPDNLIVSPGFVDEHIHGARHADSMYGNFESLKTIATAIPEEGTTSFNFTTMTMSKDVILKSLKAINSYMKDNNYGAKALGIHLEGPFISPEFCGAQNPDDILPLDTSILQEFIDASGNNIKELTFSYKDGGKEFVSYLLNHNIVPSLGHTNCTSTEAKEAFDNGVRVVTHMYNAMRRFNHRDAGTVGATLLDDRVSCELICDLHHVCKEAIQLLYKIKGKNKIILITDSMEAKYLQEGTYALGGQPVYVKDGTARLASGTLAGSILKLNEGVRNIRNVLNIPLTDAIDMASINPSKNLKVDDRIGSIKENKDADFTIIDNNVNIYKTISKGEVIFSK